MEIILVKRTLPQNPAIEVFVPNYKEPILSVNNGFGWYGLQAYNEQGQLMCHECGEFFDNLGKHTSPKHNLDAKEYKKKYGLILKDRLTSDSLHTKIRFQRLNDTSNTKRLKELSKQSQPLGAAAHKQQGQHTALEFYNKHDTCDKQLLRRLIDLAAIYGNDISVNQIYACQHELVGLLCKHFGSFNKAKQLAKLIVNKSGDDIHYSEQMILEDMNQFYLKYHRYPRRKDYETYKLICCASTMTLNGGLKTLIPKAQQLRETQEVNKTLGERSIERVKREEILEGSHSRR